MALECRNLSVVFLMRSAIRTETPLGFQGFKELATFLLLLDHFASRPLLRLAAAQPYNFSQTLRDSILKLGVFIWLRKRSPNTFVCVCVFLQNTANIWTFLCLALCFFFKAHHFLFPSITFLACHYLKRRKKREEKPINNHSIWKPKTWWKWNQKTGVEYTH